MKGIHLALLFFINALWGYNFIAGKLGTVIFGSLLFSTLRFAVVLLLLCPFLKLVKGQMKIILTIGLLLGVGHYSIMFYAMFLADNISAIAIASQLVVPFSTILAIVFLGERIGLTRSIAISMSFFGVVLIGFEPVSADHVFALILATVASVSMAAAAILMRRLQNVGVFNLQCWIALVSTIALGVLTMIIESPTLATLKGIPVTDYFYPVYSAIGATIIGHGSFYYLLQRYEVNQVAPFITLATLYAILFGIWLMDDQMTTKIVIGASLTLLGVTVIAQRNAKATTPSSFRVPR